jgi:hypothetical protein
MNDIHVSFRKNERLILNDGVCQKEREIKNSEYKRGMLNLSI